MIHGESRRQNSIGFQDGSCFAFDLARCFFRWSPRVDAPPLLHHTATCVTSTFLGHEDYGRERGRERVRWQDGLDWV
jgi:hypothetical protein